jgi:hypothetical protein
VDDQQVAPGHALAGTEVLGSAVSVAGAPPAT